MIDQNSEKPKTSSTVSWLLLPSVIVSCHNPPIFPTSFQISHWNMNFHSQPITQSRWGSRMMNVSGGNIISWSISHYCSPPAKWEIIAAVGGAYLGCDRNTRCPAHSVPMVPVPGPGTGETLPSEGSPASILHSSNCDIDVLLHTEIGKCVGNVRTNQRPRLSAWWARQPMGGAHLHTYVCICNAFANLSVSHNIQFLIEESLIRAFKEYIRSILSLMKKLRNIT